MRALLIICEVSYYYSHCKLSKRLILKILDLRSRQFKNKFIYALVLIELNLIQHDDVANAMKAVDRKNYCKADEKAKYAYQDSPQEIGKYPKYNIINFPIMKRIFD